MKLSNTKLLCLLFIFSLFLSCIAADKNSYGIEDVVKYVQGGACAPGKGTKKHPYASLAEAQADTSWDILVVLSSTVALEGGITLQSGQKLIGEENPTSLNVSPTQPTITNSSNVFNGGNGAVIIGEATIENIYFKNTFASGINYDQGTDISIKNVLVTGHNTGNPSSVLGAIQGRCPNSGKACITRTIVRNPNNTLGRGIVDRSLLTAYRELFVSHCEVANISGLGVVFSLDGTNISSAVIEDTYIHDIVGVGIQAQFVGTGAYDVTVEDSVFYNINGNHMNLLVPTNSTGNLNVCSSRFQQQNHSAGQNAIFIRNNNAQSSAIVKNSRCDNLDYFVTSELTDSTSGSTQNILIKNNIISNLVNTGGALYQARNSSTTFPSAQTTNALLEGNLYTGNNVIEITPNAPWLELTIIAECNCFTGFGFGPFFAFANSGNAGPHATIKACKNNILGFSPQINDSGTTSQINYILPKNWWGPATGPCSQDSDCQTYQTCISGQCFGPDNVVTQPGYTGTINASNPLVAPLKCPQSCCPQNKPTAPLKQESLSVEEKMEAMSLANKHDMGALVADIL